MHDTQEIWSHPNTPLLNHLLYTTQNIKTLIEESNIPTLTLNEKTILTQETIKNIALTIGALHDLGKATPFFQKYIRESNEKRKTKLKQKPETNHSLLGAMYSFYALPRSSLLQDIQERKIKLQIAFLVAITIRRHHGKIKQLKTERKYLRDEIKNFKNQNKTIYIQAHSINPEHMNEILQEIQKKLNITLPSWNEFLQSESQTHMQQDIRKLINTFDSLDKECDKINNRLDVNARTLTNENGFCFTITYLENYFYSLLQEADKTDAMGKKVIQRNKDDYATPLEEYYYQRFSPVTIKDKPTTLMDVRPYLFKETKHHATRKFQETQRVYKLEAPTGSGKTLSNIQWAFTLRKKLQKEKKKTYRILYLLPFLSVIEQNHYVIEKVLQKKYNEVPTNILLKHHHLINIEYKKNKKTPENQEEDEYTPNEKLFFIEGWNSEIIIATFYQFFHSLFTREKKNLRKYHKFMNTIIILDEIQAIPHKYWLLLEQTFPLFLEFTDSYLLMSTATQPAILHENAQPITTIGNHVSTQLKRTQIQYLESPLPYTDFITQKLEEEYFSNKKSTIIIVNTTRSSRTIYTQAKNTSLASTFELYHLSTQVIPKHRLERINQLKQKLTWKEQKPPLLITTQLVEAGVDLNFQQGFRDLAPLDSIIQSAGRVNRSGIHPQNKTPVEHAILQVQTLTHPTMKTRTLASFIYDHELINETQKILQTHKRIPEATYQKILHDYFTAVRERTNEEQARELLNAACKGDYNTLNEFKLIKEEITRIPVFIEYDKKAQETWQQYKELNQIRDWQTRQAKYLMLKKPLYDYVINVPQNQIEPIIDYLEVYGGLARLPKSITNKYYDLEIGYHGGENHDKSQEEWVL